MPLDLRGEAEIDNDIPKSIDITLDSDILTPQEKFKAIVKDYNKKQCASFWVLFRAMEYTTAGIGAIALQRVGAILGIPVYAIPKKLGTIADHFKKAGYGKKAHGAKVTVKSPMNWVFVYHKK